MLSHPKYFSTPEVHLPILGTTIAPSDLSLASSLPPCIFSIWGGRPFFPLWLPAISWSTSLCGGYPRLPLPTLPGYTSNIRLPHVSPSSLLTIDLHSGGTHPGPWASPLSPPISLCITIAPTATAFYIAPCARTFALVFLSPLLPFPTTSEISVGYGAMPPNCWFNFLHKKIIDNTTF